ncbi:peptidase domain-containing ABC transporter [Luteibacter sp. E-22]|uniref:peptidase domain-containing ABC transporter n=1 Tax=Luteibacter sp. E-22 TaxID=3404050 RepID=UPI003CEC9530
MQSQEGECGLACLAMASSAFGEGSTLTELRSRFRATSRGTTLHQLMSHAEKIGLASRAVRLEPEELGKLSLPAILHWDMRHYVLLEGVSKDYATVCDPATGRRKASKKEIFQSFTGVALELWRTSPQARRKTAPRRSFIDMLSGIKQAWPTLAALLTLTGGLELMALVSPLLSQWLIDEATSSNSKELIVTMGLGFLVVQLSQHSISYLRGLIGNHFGCDITLKRKSAFFRHLITLPTSFFETRSVGDIASRFASMEAIQQTVLSAAGTFIIDGLVALLSLTILVAYHPQIALISVLSLGIVFVIRSIALPRIRTLSALQIEHAARAQSHFIESVRGARVIHMFGRQRDRSLAWHNLLVAQYNALYKSMRLKSNIGHLCGFIMGIEGVTALCFGASAVVSGTWTLGALMAFSSYRSVFSARSSAVFEKVLELVMLKLHVDRLDDILDAESDVAAIGSNSALEAIMSEGVKLSDVTFRYGHGEQTLLKGANLTIFEGECVALIGCSGAGKSTLAKMLLGLLDPIRGEVSVGGRSGHQLRSLARSGAISAVMQDDNLFGGTIEENIHCFDSAPDLPRVQACAEAARIHDEIMGMPMGYLTLVGDMGTTLSGGQKQRVTLARSLYRQPKFLILDEATSHLDVGNEVLISAAIRDLRITRLIIAHRPETIASADRIIELVDGVLIEQGRNPGPAHGQTQ